MGNSVRSTLGNLCGAESSKDPNYDEDQRPVAKPKEEKPEKENKKSKKKNKKSKKKKKGNGELPQIEESDEPQPKDPEANVEGSTEKSSNEESDTVKKDEEPEQGGRSKDSQLTLKEQASMNDLVATGDGDSDERSEYDNDEHYEEDDDEEELKFPDEDGVRKISTDVLHKSADSVGTASANDSTDDGQRSGSEGMVSRTSNQQTLPVYKSVNEIVPEELGISYADNIFKDCAETYQIFVDKNHEFVTAVNDFQELLHPGQTHPEWEESLREYKGILENENQRDHDLSEVDISDVNASVQTIRAQAQQLNAIINNVRPTVKRHLSEAANVDVIEYVKGKMVEGEQLGITSKFSAPGKYRRNMIQLKKGASTLDEVQSEVKDIQRSLDVDPDSDVSSRDTRLSPLQDNESDIVPVTKTGPEHDTDEDIFARLKELDNEEISPKLSDKEGSYERKLLTQPKENTTEVEEDKLKTLLEKSTEINRSSPDTMTYVIETIPENTNSPTTKKVLGPSDRQPPKMSPTPVQTKSPVHQVMVEEEEHNTLDFGKYVLVDPNTGDIQVMRNRSRSLDSLVSMTSNRSSLSRFGSFEFVTDFEINIAQKNQNQML